MGQSEMLELISQNQTSICKQKYRNKSESELEELLYTSRTMALALRNASSGNELADLYQYLGEAKACEELLKEKEVKSQREEKREEQTNAAKKEWYENLEKRRAAAIINLPYSSGEIGQLIVAILEDEDGKTIEQLRGWSNELADIDEKELKNILAALVKEKVVYKDKKEKYYFLNVCSQDLFPYYPEIWCDKVCGGKLSDNEKDILNFVLEKNEPVSEKEIKINNLKTYCLGDLCDKGLLCRYKNEKYLVAYPIYYFPMLGEKRSD